MNKLKWITAIIGGLSFLGIRKLLGDETSEKTCTTNSANVSERKGIWKPKPDTPGNVIKTHIPVADDSPGLD